MICFNDRVLGAGQSGSGKTCVLIELVRRLPSYVIADPKHSEALSALFDEAAVINKAADLPLAYEKGRLKVIYRPIGLTQDELYADFNTLCDYLREVGNTTLILDEAMRVTTSSYIPPSLDILIREGREVMKVGVWAFSQRPIEIHPHLMSEAQHFFIFKLTLDQDIKKVERGGVGPLVKEAATLKPLEYIYHSMLTGETSRGVARVP